MNVALANSVTQRLRRTYSARRLRNGQTILPETLDEKLDDFADLTFNLFRK
jgi:hypothetical protein